MNNHTVVTGNQFCNPGAITIPSTAGAATPYPSNIFVTGLTGNIGAVTVQLNNISSSNIPQTDLLLVGPTGAAIIPFASVGDGSTISGVNITLDDAAASLIPGGSPLTTGTYKPTSITGSTDLIFPAPAPTIAAANYAATDGPATLSLNVQRHRAQRDVGVVRHGQFGQRRRQHRRRMVREHNARHGADYDHHQPRQTPGFGGWRHSTSQPRWSKTGFPARRILSRPLRRRRRPGMQYVFEQLVRQWSHFAQHHGAFNGNHLHRYPSTHNIS